MPIGRIFLIVAVFCWGIKASGVNTGQIDMAYAGWCFAGLAVIAGV